MLSVRPLKPEDYDDHLVGWWKDWKWQAPPRDFLPMDATAGVMVEDDGVPVFAGFFYTTNSAVCWIDWIVSSTTYRGRDKRQEALELLIDAINKVVKSLGYKYAYALIKHRGLIDTYIKKGFTQGDVYSSEMIKVI